jgi:hypothetical protein
MLASRRGDRRRALVEPVSLAERLGRAKSGRSTVVRLQIVLLIGAAEYPLTNVDAARLEHTIPRRCVDERHLPFDDDARACLQLADVLAEDLAVGASPEPIDLGMSHVEGLCERVLDDEDVLLPQNSRTFAMRSNAIAAGDPPLA